MKVTNIDLRGNWRSRLAVVVDVDDDVVASPCSVSLLLLLSIPSILLLLLVILSIERVGVAKVVSLSISSSGKAKRGVQWHCPREGGSGVVFLKRRWEVVGMGAKKRCLGCKFMLQWIVV